MIDIVFPGRVQAYKDVAGRLGYSSLCAIDIKGADYYGSSREKKSDLFVWRTLNAREAVERIRPDIIYGLEEAPRSDLIHQRNSGLNHITCRMAADKDIAIGFSFSSLLDRRTRSVRMGRMAQNIKLCRKYKVKMIIASFAAKPMHMRSPVDLKSLFQTFGMTAVETGMSHKNLQYLIDQNILKNSGKIIAKGAQLV